MSLIERARADIKDITSNTDGFGIEMTLTAPTSQTATIVGLHTKHWLSIDTEGNPVSSKNAHVSFSEEVLQTENPNYPIRNSDGEVDLSKHRFDVKDSTGLVKNYIAQSWRPDETMGLIVVILEDFE
ncbi:MAG: hypothetical protein K0S44_228 [Bacteroidetes bacterium]|jgi:hypothetical protein|nr:hypothetical protein [Bacteroidota bacterium]